MGSLWNRSGTVERYADDIRASGAKAYFFSGGTTTPMSVFADAGESSAHPHPVVADSNGRWPDVFVPYITSYDVRVTTAGDVQLTYTQQIPNPNPVDVTTTAPDEQLVQTGMIHAEFVNATKAGYVRLNGRTMGNAASGGTERANADTVNLFTYLWNNLIDGIAPVSGGRGGSAAADYAANKTITLPGCRGTVLVGLDDMGNSSLGSLNSYTFSTGSSITAGSFTGGNTVTLATGNIPAHTHTGTTSTEGAHTHSVTVSGTTSGMSADHTHTQQGSFASGGMSANVTHNHTTSHAGNILGSISVTGAAEAAGTGAGVTGDANLDHTHTTTISGQTGTASANHTHTFSATPTTDSSGSHSHTFTTSSVGSTSAFNNLGQVRLVTWFIKL